MSSQDGNRCATCQLCTDVPKIPIYAPYGLRDLDPSKTYEWCSCGSTATQPFCDHKGCEGTAFTPLSFQPRAQTLALICGCRYTRSPPYCDGRHALMEANPKSPPCRCPKADRQLDW